jgi:hypothetical protein
MTALLALLALASPTPSHAEQVFRIEVGHDYKNYSDSDLRRRVWELERAVEQLQMRVFQLEAKPTQVIAPAPATDSWICTVKAMGNTYTGTGGSKAVAKSKALEACKAGQNGDGFFCKNAECEQ